MKPNLYKRMLLLAFLMAALVIAAGAQEKKKQVFEFTVKGMKSASDAAKLDSLMMTKKGIYSCATDFKTGMVKVKTIPDLDFPTLRTVITRLGLEALDEKLKISTETQQ